MTTCRKRVADLHADDGVVRLSPSTTSPSGIGCASSASRMLASRRRGRGSPARRADASRCARAVPRRGRPFVPPVNRSDASVGVKNSNRWIAHQLPRDPSRPPSPPARCRDRPARTAAADVGRPARRASGWGATSGRGLIARRRRGRPAAALRRSSSGVGCAGDRAPVARRVRRSASPSAAAAGTPAEEGARIHRVVGGAGARRGRTASWSVRVAAGSTASSSVGVRGSAEAVADRRRRGRRRIVRRRLARPLGT
jgi:hypothetical protein